MPQGLYNGISTVKDLNRSKLNFVELKAFFGFFLIGNEIKRYQRDIFLDFFENLSLK